MLAYVREIARTGGRMVGVLSICLCFWLIQVVLSQAVFCTVAFRIYLRCQPLIETRNRFRLLGSALSIGSFSSLGVTNEAQVRWSQ